MFKSQTKTDLHKFNYVVIWALNFTQGLLGSALHPAVARAVKSTFTSRFLVFLHNRLYK